MPEIRWSLPAGFPDLQPEEPIALDLETYDPNLKSIGPGFCRNDGHIAGIALATAKEQWYFPIAHRDGPNLDRQLVFRWLVDTLKSGRIYYLANANYDMGWLSHETGIQLKLPYDITIADTLLDEEQFQYGLETLAKRHLGIGKDETLLKEVASSLGIDAKADLWKMDSRYVGPYAEMDARLTFDVATKQIAAFDRIADTRLNDVLQMEMALIPHILNTNRTGVRVDLEAAERLNDRFLSLQKDMWTRFGVDRDHQFRELVWSGNECARWLKSQNIDVPVTEAGNPSIQKDWLESFPDNSPPALLRDARVLERCQNIYIRQNVLEGHHNGRVFPQFLQTRSDEGGTRTFRFACKKPNLQQIPKRSGRIPTHLIRKLYLPEPGELWGKHDYNSQEPRLQVHYGMCCRMPTAFEAAKYMEKGHKLYKYIEEKCRSLTYDQAKAVLLGRSYGMMATKMSAQMGIELTEAKQVLKEFDEQCAFIGQLFTMAEQTAATKGVIKSILGRHLHFDMWEPMDRNAPMMKGRKQAERVYSGERLQRAATYKAFNKLIQGSAADQTKKAFLDCALSGRRVLVQIHDELGVSESSPETAKETREIMQDAVKMMLPSVVDTDLGATWQ